MHYIATPSVQYIATLSVHYVATPSVHYIATPSVHYIATLSSGVLHVQDRACVDDLKMLAMHPKWIYQV